jgi:hypothetical protein
MRRSLEAGSSSLRNLGSFWRRADGLIGRLVSAHQPHLIEQPRHKVELQANLGESEP